jgi:hypothetical protein
MDGLESLQPRKSDAGYKCASGVVRIAWQPRDCAAPIETGVGLRWAGAGRGGENQGERQGGDDDYDHRQGAIVRQSADQQCAERRDHHLQEAEQPGSGAGDAGMDAEAGRDCRRLAQTIADGANCHRHEQRPGRQLGETPDREHDPRGERQGQADDQKTGTADGHGTCARHRHYRPYKRPSAAGSSARRCSAARASPRTRGRARLPRT